MSLGQTNGRKRNDNVEVIGKKTKYKHGRKTLREIRIKDDERKKGNRISPNL